LYPIRLIVVGRPKQESILSLEKHYKKLIKPLIRLEILELTEGKGQGERQLLDEASNLRNALSAYKWKVILDAGGRTTDSEGFAKWLGSRLDLGEHMAFAIGSSNGIHSILKAEIKERMSLSQMTFPHDLCRIIFLEQLYRAMSILRGGSYHK